MSRKRRTPEQQAKHERRRQAEALRKQQMHVKHLMQEAKANSLRDAELLHDAQFTQSQQAMILKQCLPQVLLTLVKLHGTEHLDVENGRRALVVDLDVADVDDNGGWGLSFDPRTDPETGTKFFRLAAVTKLPDTY